MNKYIFIIKFIANKQDSGKYNWNLLFPFAGVIIGCITVSLTLSIMEGMEYAIFTKLENISFPGKLEKLFTADINDLEDLLQSNNISFQKGIEDQIILMKNSNFRLVTIHGVEKFTHFKEYVFGSDMIELIGSTDISKLYVGSPLSIKLDMSLGDTILIVHPKNINIFTTICL